jgi:uncharacterized protein YkwD
VVLHSVRPWRGVRPGRAALAGLAFVLIAAQFLAVSPLGARLVDRSVQAHTPGQPYFARTWARTDKPVADGEVARTWMWGPEANTPVLEEPYAESPGGRRLVQYFDKSRMEITHPDAVDDGVWYVTNGLLVVELVSGRRQLGNDLFVQHAPADVNVAGDPDDPHGPTYATFGKLRSQPPLEDGGAITHRIDRAGHISGDLTLARHGATAALRVTVPGLDHQVASPFLDFMRSSGIVYVDDAFVHDRLFVHDFYATGLPITEAYWATVRVGGTPLDVLVQCFERRCLTWTPSNPPAWQVEAGNVGLHYQAWRATHPPDEPDEPDTPSPTATFEPAATGTTPGTATMTTSTATAATATATWTPAPAETLQPFPTFTPTPTRTPSPTPSPTPTPTPTATPIPGSPDPVEWACLSVQERDMLERINAHRVALGLAPLTVSVRLNRAAYGFAYDMADRNYYPYPASQNTQAPYPLWLGGPGVDDRLATAGYTGYTVVAEILGYGLQYSNAEAMFAAWRNSNPHNAKLLQPDVTQVGIGHADKPGAIRNAWVVVLANGNDTTTFACP